MTIFSRLRHNPQRIKLLYSTLIRQPFQRSFSCQILPKQKHDNSNHHRIQQCYRKPFVNHQMFCSRSSSSSADRREDDVEKTIGLATLVDDMISYLPHHFLMDADLLKWDSKTHQRLQLESDFDANDGKPLLSSRRTGKLEVETYWLEEMCKSSNHQDDVIIVIQWTDGTISKYSKHWIKNQLSKIQEITKSSQDGAYNNNSSLTKPHTEKILWSNLQESDLRTHGKLALDFESIFDNDEAMEEAICILYQYGILLVTNTPFHDDGAAVAAFSAAVSGGTVKTSSSISLLKHYRDHRGKDTSVILPDGTDGPLRTLYGGVWSTTSEGMPEGGSVADSAYGQGSLPLHNDMTYMNDPPGLQIFQMIQPAIQGGESVYGDGLAMAERLREQSPKSFHTLCSIERNYHSIDDGTGWHLQASGPIIQADPNGDGTYGKVKMIRHNDLDRLPDLPSKSTLQQGIEAIDEFYDNLNEAHYKWDQLIAEDEFRLEAKLNPGDLVAVVNQRCFHGRKSFSATKSAPRAVGGAYTSQVELDSRFRRAGFVVD